MARSKKFQLMLSNEGHEALENIAEKERRPLADVVRQALEEYVEKHGIKVSFAVDRGGYRKRPTSPSDT